ncbi:hypothetical protein PICMEDRAFT_8977 [Pichia membranifaciens NRRL Y-2026]|uniref:Rab-GAP TBC domain-containing protein n=1 Tax=Pichia membranifaciens NRRL Y-2026 TaxID=763406 RepID=A0A1E3NQU8_9ASCO|nr:hypothetical protein PICMEDRAFT_8977 [Pichia membranifaciens NRRL Y-2026]ODQ48435.1 hypothetical protein PICMEDRAFT_8977 [Pichia membranifaciens NRRL Y-2026]
MISTLDVIQESFEDVPLEYAPTPPNHFYGLNRQNSMRNHFSSANNVAGHASASALSLNSNNSNSTVNMNLNGGRNARANYSASSLNNSSRELLLTPSQKLKIIKKQRVQMSQDQLSTNCPEALNAIDFLSDDELPDDLIVYDVPSLYSLQSLSHNKPRTRRPSVRRNNSISSHSDNNITNTHNINQQIENTTPSSNSNSNVNTTSSSYDSNNTNNLTAATKYHYQPPHSHFVTSSCSSSASSATSSPATRASSIFSCASDISEFSCADDEYLNPLSADARLLLENKDYKLEEALQRMSMLRNMSHLCTKNSLTANNTGNRNSDPNVSLASTLSVKSEPRSQYLSSTRPVNLPPKTKYEVSKHEKDYQNILEAEIYNEKEKLRDYQVKKKLLIAQAAKDEKLWSKVINNYDVLIKLPQTRELWWRNLPDKYRGNIWKKQLISKKNVVFGNSVLKKALSDASSTLNQACNFKSTKDELAKRQKGKVNPDLLEDVRFIEECADKLQYSFPEMKYFQYGENFDAVLQILIAIRALKNENKNLESIDIMKTINLVCILTYVFDDHLTTLSCFISLLSKKLPNFMLCSDEIQIPSDLLKDLEIQKSKTQSTYFGDIKDQFDKYLLQLTPRLYNHFIQRDINSLKIIQGLACSIFSNQLPFDVVLRVMDIYFFEGDILLLRASLALLKKISFKLYGSKEEVYNLLKVDGLINSSYLEVGEVDEFIKDIRDVLKKN